MAVNDSPQVWLEVILSMKISVQSVRLVGKKTSAFDILAQIWWDLVETLFLSSRVNHAPDSLKQVTYIMSSRSLFLGRILDLEVGSYLIILEYSHSRTAKVPSDE